MKRDKFIAAALVALLLVCGLASLAASTPWPFVIGLVAVVAAVLVFGRANKTGSPKTDGLDQKLSRSPLSLSLLNPWNPHRRY